MLQIELMSSSCHGDSAELLPHRTGSLAGRGDGSPRRQPAARCQSLSEGEHLNKDAGAIKGRLRGLPQTNKENVSGHLLENNLRTSVETNQGSRLLNLQKVFFAQHVLGWEHRAMGC